MNKCRYCNYVYCDRDHTDPVAITIAGYTRYKPYPVSVVIKMSDGVEVQYIRSSDIEDNLHERGT